MKFIAKHKILFIVLFIIVLFSIYVINGLKTPLTIVEYTCQNDKIPEDFSGYTIVQISDLHCKNFGTQQSQLIDAIAGCNPDIIVLTGDIVDGDHTDITPALQLLEGIQNLAPIYFITGNHELTSSAWAQYQDFLKAFETYGVTDLDDNQVTLTSGNSSIRLYGRKYFSKFVTLDLPIASQDDFDILLYHGSDNFEELAPYHYDLILSGHAHGGIIRLPVLGGIIGNDGNFFPKYDRGMFTFQNSTLISSAGLGDSNMPRFYNPPEITVIKLLP